MAWRSWSAARRAPRPAASCRRCSSDQWRASDAQLGEEPGEAARLGVAALEGAAEKLDVVGRLGLGDGEAVRRLVGEQRRAPRPDAVVEGVDDVDVGDREAV